MHSISAAMRSISGAVRDFSAAVPLFLPAVLLSVVLGMTLAPTVARLLATRRAVAFLLLASIGIILAATLTPGAEALASGAPSGGGCDLSRMGLAPLSLLTRVSGASLNVLLFVPLGIAVALLPWSGRSMAVVVGAILLPFVVEAIQMLAPDLGRACESADIVDNLTGLVIGLAVGSAATLLGRRWSRPT